MIQTIIQAVQNYFDSVSAAFTTYPVFFYFVITILGLLVGSFLNVVIYRLPIMLENAYKDEYQEYFYPEKELPKREKFNLMVPASHCPNCNHKISAIENIPLLSFLCLRGKCKECGQKISFRYPFVEALTAILSFIVAYKFGPHLATLGGLILCWSLVALSGIDFDKKILPDEIIFPVLWLGIILNLFTTYTDITSSIFGAVFGYLILWLIYWTFKIIFGKEGMGYGDFKLTALLGAWIGYQYLGILVLMPAFVGLIGYTLFFIYSKVFTKTKQEPEFAYGPYIAISGFIALIYGPEINSWYLHTMMGM